MKNLVMLMLVALALVACSSTTPTATPAAPAGDPAQNTAPQETPQMPGMGAVEGVLLDQEGKPIEGVGVYVAKISVDGVISYSPEADPRDITDAEGRFRIPNIAPATYALAYWTPGPTGLIYDPANPQFAVQVEVKADETTNSGSHKIQRP
ncbi:MAG TPA: hypothetical protein VD886_11565 [Herpetosiphonaceae bacterium]|nr:hypothetical protein [Herpetosiphonaceae bacterium]